MYRGLSPGARVLHIGAGLWLDDVLLTASRSCPSVQFVASDPLFAPRCALLVTKCSQEHAHVHPHSLADLLVSLFATVADIGGDNTNHSERPLIQPEDWELQSAIVEVDPPFEYRSRIERGEDLPPSGAWKMHTMLSDISPVKVSIILCRALFHYMIAEYRRGQPASW